MLEAEPLQGRLLLWQISLAATEVC
ncbi:hypothetical protein CBM2599_B50381 [Cupriavidus taiwanensis]|nr:hypothetical protein CBM2600_B10609 [Cupriavidus taiwanensis]SOY96449.1 hypothetical protein CBM2599_B50381 [Cupriavidus taiwanensis]